MRTTHSHLVAGDPARLREAAPPGTVCGEDPSMGISGSCVWVLSTCPCELAPRCAPPYSRSSGVTEGWSPGSEPRGHAGRSSQPVIATPEWGTGAHRVRWAPMKPAPGGAWHVVGAQETVLRGLCGGGSPEPCTCSISLRPQSAPGHGCLGPAGGAPGCPRSVCQTRLLEGRTPRTPRCPPSAVTRHTHPEQLLCVACGEHGRNPGTWPSSWD